MQIELTMEHRCGMATTALANAVREIRQLSAEPEAKAILAQDLSEIFNAAVDLASIAHEVAE